MDSKRAQKVHAPEAMAKALRDIENGMKMSAAARKHGIPRSTLDDHATGKYKGYSTSFGPQRSVSIEDEETLARYLIYMSEQGYPLTRKMLKVFVLDIVKVSGRPSPMNMVNGPSDHWVAGFLTRHPMLSFGTPHPVNMKHAAVSQATIKNFYDILEKELERVQSDPSRIFNMDETGNQTLSSNILVRIGMIPETLQDILFPPPKVLKKSKPSACAEAHVIPAPTAQVGEIVTPTASAPSSTVQGKGSGKKKGKGRFVRPPSVNQEVNAPDSQVAGPSGLQSLQTPQPLSEAQCVKYLEPFEATALPLLEGNEEVPIRSGRIIKKTIDALDSLSDLDFTVKLDEPAKKRTCKWRQFEKDFCVNASTLNAFGKTCSVKSSSDSGLANNASSTSGTSEATIHLVSTTASEYSANLSNNSESSASNTSNTSESWPNHSNTLESCSNPSNTLQTFSNFTNTPESSTNPINTSKLCANHSNTSESFENQSNTSVSSANQSNIPITNTDSNGQMPVKEFIVLDSRDFKQEEDREAQQQSQILQHQLQSQIQEEIKMIIHNLNTPQTLERLHECCDLLAQVRQKLEN